MQHVENTNQNTNYGCNFIDKFNNWFSHYILKFCLIISIRRITWIAIDE